MNLFNFLKTTTTGGTKVLPIKFKEKKPSITGWPASASSDSSQIEKWFKDKEMNAGIPTGTLNGFWVLDIDKKNNGYDSLKKLIEMFGDLIGLCAYVVDTGGGGHHLYFKLNDGQIIPTLTNLLPGIDVRGEGGQIVSPFSTHQSGNLYLPRIIHEDKNLYVDQLSYAPEGLIEFIKKSKSPLRNPISDIAVSPYRPIAKEKIKEGGRNDALFKRLCQLRSAPFSCEGFLATARAENLLLCDPPLDDSEVKQIAQSTFHRYQSKELIEPKIKEEAFYGVLGKLVNLIKDETEASKESLLFQAIVILGNLLDRKFHILITGSCIYTNEFTLIIGKTSKARKGTSFKAIAFFFKKVWGDTFNFRLHRGVSTGEGIIWSLRDPMYQEIEDNKGNKKRKLIDSGVENKSAIYLEEEFSKPLKNGKRETNNLTEILRIAFDADDLQSISKSQPARVSNPFISLIGHTTKEEFTKTLNDVDKDNGLLNRFLFCHSYRANIIPHPKDFDLILKESDILIDLYALKDFIDKSEPQKISFTDEANQWWDNFYRAHGNALDESNENIKGRTEAHILKVAMIYAVSDRTSVITEDHLKAAKAILDYSNQSIDYVFGNKNKIESSNEEKILKFISMRSNDVSRTDISYNLFNKKMKADELNLYRDQLTNAGKIEICFKDKAEFWKIPSDMSI